MYGHRDGTVLIPLPLCRNSIEGRVMEVTKPDGKTDIRLAKAAPNTGVSHLPTSEHCTVKSLLQSGFGSDPSASFQQTYKRTTPTPLASTKLCDKAHVRGNRGCIACLMFSIHREDDVGEYLNLLAR